MSLTFLFLGGGSLIIWVDALTHAGGVQGYLSEDSGRVLRSLRLAAATFTPLMLGFWVAKMVAWGKSPIYLDGTLLHAESWRQPLDMRLVDRIFVDEAGWMLARPSYCVFLLKDGSRRRLPVSFYERSAYGVAVALEERFSIPVEHAKADLPLS